MIPRVVLDTNVVVSALLKPHRSEDIVLRLGLAGKLQLCTSPAVLTEYEAVLPRPKFKLSPQDVAVVLKHLREDTKVVRPTHTLSISKDERDNRFLECAEAARADYLVTGNAKHFPARHKVAKIVNARQLLEVLAPGGRL